MSDVRQVLEDWHGQEIGFVRFELPDMHGISRSKTIPIAHALDYAERGLNMYGGASVLDTRSDVVPGTLYHEERGYGDQLLFPDPDSAAVIPWADRTARLICDVHNLDHTAFEGCPRTRLKLVLEQFVSLGYKILVAPEIEFSMAIATNAAGPKVNETLDQVCGKLVHLYATT